MTQSTDTPELRKAFCEEFMWMSDLDHERMTMPEIMEEFDIELGQAKRLYGRAIDTEAAWGEACTWLSDRGYQDPAQNSDDDDDDETPEEDGDTLLSDRDE